MNLLHFGRKGIFFDQSMEFPPPPPERSKLLHNFTLPYLRWGHQRSLRCVNLPSSSSSPPSPDHGERRRNLSIDLVCDGKPALGNGGGEEAEARPWNLRTRRAACNEPGGGDDPTTTTTTTRMIITNEIGGVKRGGEGGGDGSEKLKFSVCLLREEIEEDFTALIGKKPPRRPKKRPRLVQKQMNVINYKVPSFFS